MGFNGKTVWRFQTKKKNKNIIIHLSKKPVEHKDPEIVN